MFFFLKSFWSGWRNKVFMCERKVRFDILELNVNKNSLEVGR